MNKLKILSLSLILIISFEANAGEDRNVADRIRPAQVTQAEASIVVSTVSDLATSLAAAVAGDIVFVDKTAVLDVTGAEGMTIPGGVTLASAGSGGGVGGALLYTDQPQVLYEIFKTGGEGVRITGLRIIGPDDKIRKDLMTELSGEGAYYTAPTSAGISVLHDNIVIDRSEIAGFGHAGIKVTDGINNALITGNNIHHNQRHGLGYGVVVINSQAVIEHNYFDWNRHAISSTGEAAAEYEARYNCIGQNHSDHAFDMHEGADDGDGTSTAGKRVSIHNNIFHVNNHESIRIAGNPTDGAWVYDNCFEYQSEAENVVFIKNGPENIEILRNQYGACSGKITEYSMDGYCPSPSTGSFGYWE